MCVGAASRTAPLRAWHSAHGRRQPGEGELALMESVKSAQSTARRLIDQEQAEEAASASCSLCGRYNVAVRVQVSLDSMSRSGGRPGL